MRYQTGAILIFSLLVSVNLTQFELVEENDSISLISDPFTFSQVGYQIVIDSNSDFASQGWSGNGSETNPYILDRISLSTGLSPAIEIRNTDAHFILNNSVLGSIYTYDPGIIALYNVANGIISNCQLSWLTSDEGIGIYGSQVSNSSIMDCLLSGGTGLYFEYSSHCNLSGNTIPPKSEIWGSGVLLRFSNQMFVNDNTVMYREYGINLESTDDCILINNSIIGGLRGLGIDFPYGSVGQSVRNVVYSNSFGWLYDYNARDYGFQNQWDDNISLGNAYSDYNGSDYYEIPGSAGSIDRYPRKLIDDIYGPIITHTFPYYYTDYVLPGPEFFFIDAEVTDISGVDTVLLTFNGTVYVMNESKDDAFPNRFRFELPYRGLYNHSIYFTYKFKANDTLGNSFETCLSRGYISVWPLNPPPTSNTSPTSNSSPTSNLISPVMISVIFASGIFVTCVCIVFVRERLKSAR